MLTSSFLLSALALSAASSPIQSNTKRQSSSSSSVNVTDALWDGQCFYPKADEDDFDLEDYLGRWYQVAGTVAPFTAGCKCIYAEYSLNSNGTVAVNNGCQLPSNDTGSDPIPITISGVASPADEKYGDSGVFRVQFPGQPAPDCPGPNYIVQEVEDADDDDGWAIVQASNFTTLFLLSREQNPSEAKIERWVQRAGRYGSDLSNVVRTDQTGCVFT